MKAGEGVASDGRDRQQELDILRGLAALLVVLYHYTTRYFELYAPGHAPAVGVPWGHYGVNLFFVISGYVIHLTLSRTGGLGRFAVARFSRLYPTYWVAVIATTVVLHFWATGSEITPAQFFINFTMIQELFHTAPIDGVYWTLRIELYFYVIMALIFLLGMLKHMERVLAFWLLAFLAWHALPEGLRGRLNFRGLGTLEDFLFLQQYANLFIMGVAFHVARENRSPRLYGLAGLCVAAELLVRGLPDGITALLIYLVFGLLIGQKLRALRCAPLLYLGVISYPLYLTHQKIGYVIIQKTQGLGLSVAGSIGVAFCLAVGGASLISFGWERPVMRLIRKVPGRRRRAD